MPKRYVTFRAEFCYRHASIPYFTGEGGITPPAGNQGAPGSVVDGFVPDLVHNEPHFTLALLVKL